jgi:hypothetical protein
MDKNVIGHNARVYEPLRCQRALLSSYHKATKSAGLRKASASNGLYTLLALVALLFFVFNIY